PPGADDPTVVPALRQGVDLQLQLHHADQQGHDHADGAPRAQDHPAPQGVGRDRLFRSGRGRLGHVRHSHADRAGGAAMEHPGRRGRYPR
ncbi:MAG: hypothetical protein AMXMBFR83_10850, partial [Phycisphaerae bacterium]